MYKAIFFLSDVRCGSTYAAELLAYNANAQLGMELWELPREPFQSLTDETSGEELEAHFDGLWANPHGWRSGMVKCAHLSIINKLCAECDAAHERFFGPDAYWVLIHRDDVFARAVSLAHALGSGRFHEYSDPSAGYSDYAVSNEQVRDCLGRIALADTFLSGCTPRFAKLREFHYEDIMADERGFVNAVGEFAFGQSILGSNDELVTPKLQPVHSAEKARQREEFVNWFIRQYHEKSI